MMDKKELESIPICHIHNIIQDKCAELVNIEDLDKDKVLEIADEILQLSFVAEKQGQRMEDRMRLYKEGIEKLGFARNKKGVI